MRGAHKNLMRKLITLTILMSTMVFWVTSCRRQTSDNEAPDLSGYHPEKPPANDYERALRDVREGHFKFMWIFKRLDGNAFTKEDGDILRKAAPKVVDWVKTDQNRVIAGSNFDLDPPQMVVLQKRFKVEDYSGK